MNKMNRIMYDPILFCGHTYSMVVAIPHYWLWLSHTVYPLSKTVCVVIPEMYPSCGIFVPSDW